MNTSHYHYCYIYWSLLTTNNRLCFVSCWVFILFSDFFFFCNSHFCHCYAIFVSTSVIVFVIIVIVLLLLFCLRSHSVSFSLFLLFFYALALILYRVLLFFIVVFTSVLISPSLLSPFSCRCCALLQCALHLPPTLSELLCRQVGGSSQVSGK